MPNSLLINLSALIALLPASLLAMRHDARRDIVFWLLLGVALAGATTQTIVNSADGWRSDVASALWLSITASLAIFSVICVFVRDAWRLAPLFSPYMLGLGLCAVAWGSTKAHDVLTPLSGVGTWIGLHIFVSVSTYGLVTIAAIAALGAIVQERALKAKTQTSLSKRLPALTDCDRLVIRLLGLGEAILALGLISGMAVQTYETGSLFSLTHKTVLSLVAFAAIGCLLFTHFRTGLRGRKAARLVLLAYLLLTLGYPGVKFVTDVLLAG